MSEIKQEWVAPSASGEASVLDAAVAQTEDREMRRGFASIELGRKRMEFDREMARVMYKSGVYKDLKDCIEEEAIAKAQLKIMLGRAHGMTEMEALQSLYIVNGKPSVSSDFRAARMKRAGYDWDFLRSDSTGCVIALSKDGKPLMGTDQEGKPKRVTVSFVEADAKRAGLLDEKHGSGMYAKWGDLMYWYKCISKAQKMHAPHVLGADFADYEEVVSQYADDGAQSTGEVIDRLHIEAAPNTREAQAEVAEKKIAEAKAVAATPAQAAPAKMTLGGGK